MKKIFLPILLVVTGLQASDDYSRWNVEQQIRNSTSEGLVSKIRLGLQTLQNKGDLRSEFVNKLLFDDAMLVSAENKDLAVSIAGLALEFGANPDVKEGGGLGIISTAIYHQNPELVKLILEHKYSDYFGERSASPDGTSSPYSKRPSEFPLFIIADQREITSEHVEIAKALVEAGANLEAEDHMDRTPLQRFEWALESKKRMEPGEVEQIARLAEIVELLRSR